MRRFAVSALVLGAVLVLGAALFAESRGWFSVGAGSARALTRPLRLEVVSPDAYEQLLMQAMLSNPALFIRRDEVEQAWTWIDSIQDAWKTQREPPKPYAAGSWGPVASVALLSRDGREWSE